MPPANFTMNKDKDVLGHQKRSSEEESSLQTIEPKKRKLQRTVMNASEELNFMYNPVFLPFLLHFYIAKELFHRNVGKNTNEGLPRKTVKNHHDAIDSIVYLDNPELLKTFEEKKTQFRRKRRSTAVFARGATGSSSSSSSSSESISMINYSLARCLLTRWEGRGFNLR